MATFVRSATVQDATAITDVNIASWQAAYAGIVEAGFLEQLATPGYREQRELRWRERIADPGSPVLVAVSDDVIVGYCGLALPSRDEDAGDEVAELAAIYVSPASFRGGVGSTLMSQVLELLARTRYCEVSLWVLSANASAQAFYTRHGFRADGAVKRLEELAAEETRMRRRL